MKNETPSLLKVFMIFVMSIFFGLKGLAEDTSPFLYYMQIALKDGSHQEILLNEFPVVTFEKNTLTISTTKDEIIYNDIALITFSEKLKDEPTGLNEVKKSENPLMRVSDDKVVFSHLDRKSRVDVYTLQGKLIASSSSDSGDEITIDWVSFTPGVYIFRVNQRSFKLIKK